MSQADRIYGGGEQCLNLRMSSLELGSRLNSTSGSPGATVLRARTTTAMQDRQGSGLRSIGIGIHIHLFPQLGTGMQFLDH